ncbi:MAG: 6-phosphogluconolactonase [Thermodesulfovibrionales bacterium]
MNSRPEIVVFESDEDMHAFVIREWGKIASEAVARRGYFAVAISGGKTPVPLLRRLSGADGKLPWDKTHLFLVDERIVPYSHPDSNWGMVSATLVKPTGIPVENCHPILVEDPVPEISAARYERDIMYFFGSRQKGVPVFDLVLLGIGEDGHVASLFPGNQAVREAKRLVAAVIPGDARHARITLTLPVINHAENVFALVSGRSKSRIMNRVLVQRDKHLPSTLVKPVRGNLVIIMDPEAASELPSEMIHRVPQQNETSDK